METGSSASSTRGRTASARAMATRCRWPPDSSCGYLRRNCAAGVSATRLQQAGRWPSSRSAPGWPSAVDLQRPGQVVAHVVHGVEGGERVLQDQLDVAGVLAAAPAGRGHRVAVQQQLAGRGRDQPGQHPGQRGLAGAALAHHGGDPGLRQRQRDVLDRVHHRGSPAGAWPAARPRRRAGARRSAWSARALRAAGRRCPGRAGAAAVSVMAGSRCSGVATLGACGGRSAPGRPRRAPRRRPRPCCRAGRGARLGQGQFGGRLGGAVLQPAGGQPATGCARYRRQRRRLLRQRSIAYRSAGGRRSRPAASAGPVASRGCRSSAGAARAAAGTS